MINLLKIKSDSKSENSWENLNISDRKTKNEWRLVKWIQIRPLKKKKNISTSLLTPGHQVRHLFKRVIITRPDYRRFLFKNWGAAQGTFQWKAS